MQRWLHTQQQMARSAVAQRHVTSIEMYLVVVQSLHEHMQPSIAC